MRRWVALMPDGRAKALKMRHKVRHFVRSRRFAAFFNRLRRWFFSNLSAICQVLLAIWPVAPAFLSLPFRRRGVTFEVKKEERGLRGLFFVGFWRFTAIRTVFPRLMTGELVLMPEFF